MIVKKVELHNFRNYENLELSFDSSRNVFIGENAQVPFNGQPPQALPSSVRGRGGEGRACGGCPLKGDYANFALISRLRAAASPEGEAKESC